MQAPHATPQLLVALNRVRLGDRVPLFVVLGDTGAADTAALLAAIHSAFVPLKVYLSSHSFRFVNLLLGISAL